MDTIKGLLALIGIAALVFSSVAYYHDVKFVTPADLDMICTTQPQEHQP